jgi:branched-chain amino acid transport system permease protein
VQLVVLGAGTGALYGLLALGLVLIYKSTRVLSFAQGGVAMMTGFVAWSLVNEADVHYATAILLSLEFAVILGLLVDRVLLRWVRDRGRLSAVIMTVALGVLLQSIVVLRWSSQEFYRLQPVFIRKQVEVLGTSMSSETLLVLLTAAILIVLLYLFFRFVPWGLAVRATADDGDAAEYVGIDTRAMTSLAWMLGCGVAGLAGLLIAPLVVMDAYQIPLLTVKALGAALLGGLVSLPGAMLGGILIGVVEAQLASRVHVIGFNDFVIFALVVGFIALRAKPELVNRLQEDLTA